MTAPRTRLRRLGVIALACAQTLLLAAGAAVGGARWVAAPLDGEDPYALLVLGSDAGPPRSGTADSGRADAIHLLVVSPGRDAVSIVSFPRDSWVPVRGLGTRKLNAGLTQGPQAMAVTITDLTGIEVDDWIVTGFDGFVGAIDTLGGVEVEVERRLRDPQGAHSDLHAGQQVLTGTQALAFTRDRKSRPDGDMGRSRAQAQTLVALHEQLLADRADPRRLLELAAVLRQHTVSSIPPDRLLRLAHLAATTTPDRIVLEPADGRLGWAGPASVVRLTDAAYATFDDLRVDGVLDAVEDAAG